MLFIDARKFGQMVDRTRKELTEDDVGEIARTYHAWRGEPDTGIYEDTPGYCKSAQLESIRTNEYVLTPGRYVGASEQEEDDEPFDQKMRRLTALLKQQQEEGTKLDKQITENLNRFGYEA